MNPFSTIGHRIFSLRVRHGWTQQELADHVNRTRYRPDVKQPHIAGLEKSTGEKLPSVPLLAALAEVFGVDMEALIGIDNMEKVPDVSDDLLSDLSAEDKALALAIISRLRSGVGSADADWRRLSKSVAANGGHEMVRSLEQDLGVFLEPAGD